MTPLASPAGTTGPGVVTPRDPWASGRRQGKQS